MIEAFRFFEVAVVGGGTAMISVSVPAMGDDRIDL